MAIEVPDGKTLPKPEWLKARAPGNPEYLATKNLVGGLKLHTVCKEAQCPNIGECWAQRTATFLIMGEYCTRRCRFCSVKDGTRDTLQPLDPSEPARVAEAVQKLQLRHAVITSVDRDDLPDFGAGHFAAVVTAVKRLAPDCSIELLIPDLQGHYEHLKTIMETGIAILNHNLETVRRLYREVRPQAGYERSLSILRWAKELDPKVRTKSGIMVGLGETKEEVLELMDDLRRANVDIMTIGQYLRPSAKQMPLRAYITPEEFKEYEEEGLKRGFAFVESGPFVRSSYHAAKHAG